MKQNIKDFILRAVSHAHQKGDLPSADIVEAGVDEPKAEAHGDFSTNAAMVMASIQKMPPRKIAEIIIRHIQDPQGILEKTEIAGPGFINFFLKPSAWHPVLREIHDADTRYGATDIGQGQRFQVEFVSSNPTGPLHVGHGRGAAVGDAVANILSFCGYDVQKEYYINDSGRQIETLGRSVFLRYQEMFGQKVKFPDECYQGEYIRDLAGEIKTEKKRHPFKSARRPGIDDLCTLCGRQNTGRHSG